MKSVPKIERPISGRIVTRCTTGKTKPKAVILTPSRSVTDIASSEVKTGGIYPEQILLQSQESNYSRVYEINLHATDVKKIENLNKFRKLRKLDLSSNHIRKIENLDSNSDVRDLKLYDNDITTIENIEGLAQLCYLQLQHNKIKTIGKGLAKLKNLTELRVDNNIITDVTQAELCTCHRLTSLDISNNQLHDITNVNCLPNLQELRASSNHIQCIVDLSQCKRLQDLDLSHNLISDLPALRALHHLQTLNVSSNRISNLKSIGPIRSLCELTIADNRLTDISSIAVYYPNIQIFDACDNKIAHIEDLRHLTECTDLVELYVAGNPLFDHDSPQNNYFGALQQMLPRLDILDKAHIKKTPQSGAPVMRPMSVASVITVRHVEGQLTNFCDELKNMETDIFKKFSLLRESCGALPSHSPRVPSTSHDSPADLDGNTSRHSPSDSVGNSSHDSPSDVVHCNDADEVVNEGGATDRAEMSSRCGSRQRIQAALSFAAENFATEPEL